MFARIEFHKSGLQDFLSLALLDGEQARELDFWFGRALIWTSGESTTLLAVSVLADIVALAGRKPGPAVRRRIGYTEPVCYSGTALLGLAISAVLGRSLPELEVPVATTISIDAFEHTEVLQALVSRLFRPQGYEVAWTPCAENAVTLNLTACASPIAQLSELAALLTVLDRRLAPLLDNEELLPMRRRAERRLRDHPAASAIFKVLNGESVPTSALVSPGAIPHRESRSGSDTPAPAFSKEVLTTSLRERIVLAPSQIRHAAKTFHGMNILPDWFVYLPPGMASVQGDRAGTFEDPMLALAYYRGERVRRCVVEFKHMGSRAIVIVCRDLNIAKRRFGVAGQLGCVYTRNARAFFTEPATECNFLERLKNALDRSRLWDRLQTGWLCLDGEILPWSFKANSLEKAEGSILVSLGMRVCAVTWEAVSQSVSGPIRGYWLEKLRAREHALGLYSRTYAHYRDQPSDIGSVRFAPFHIVAGEGRSFLSHSHLWHMEVLERATSMSPDFLVQTPFQVLDLENENCELALSRSWEELCAAEAEGIVIKPFHFSSRGRRGICQPAIKCRTPAHLRLVYGPDYETRANLNSLSIRPALLNRRNKHRRILRQFALSIEAVERFVSGRGLEDVHECLLGILGLEVAPNERKTAIVVPASSCRDGDFLSEMIPSSPFWRD